MICKLLVEPKIIDIAKAILIGWMMMTQQNHIYNDEIKYARKSCNLIHSKINNNKSIGRLTPMMISLI